MLLKTKLEIFVAKKALVFYIVLSLLDVIFIRQRWIIFAGLTFGGIFSLIKFGATAAAFSRLLSKDRNCAAVNHISLKYAINQIFIIILLAASLKYNIWLFLGMILGILLVPFVIIVNGITEGLSITHNNFE